MRKGCPSRLQSVGQKFFYNLEFLEFPFADHALKKYNGSNMFPLSIRLPLPGEKETGEVQGPKR